MLIDPNGEDARIAVDGNNVKITIPIYFNPKGSFSADKMSAAISNIEKAWSGKAGKYNVETKVEVVSDPSTAIKTPQINVGVFMEGKGDSYVEGKNETTGMPTRMVLYDQDAGGKTKDNDSITGHEAGHLLGLGEGYKETGKKDANGNRITEPAPGRSGDIMAQRGGKMTQAGVDEAIANKAGRNKVEVKPLPKKPDEK